MVKLVDISVDDLIKYDAIFKRAEMLFGWNSGDAKKIVKDSQESILFCYHPIFSEHPQPPAPIHIPSFPSFLKN